MCARERRASARAISGAAGRGGGIGIFSSGTGGERSQTPLTQGKDKSLRTSKWEYIERNKETTVLITALRRHT